MRHRVAGRKLGRTSSHRTAMLANLASSLIRDKHAVHKAFAELAARFRERQGGYTRVLKMGWRHGDAAPMAMIEYLSAARAAGEGSEAPAARKPAAKKEKRSAAGAGVVPAASGRKAAKEPRAVAKGAPAAKRGSTRQKKPSQAG